MENIKGGKTLETIDTTLNGIFAVALAAKDDTTLFVTPAVKSVHLNLGDSNYAA